ncbi:MAG: alr0857 family protein [Elainellaceae cyanobacterium]
MLRLIYTETGLDLKVIDQPVEEWIALRRSLAHRTGHVFRSEACTASFLLPKHLRQMEVLRRWLECDRASGINLALADAEFMEVSLTGHWITSYPADAEGVFVAALHPRLEAVIAELWEKACDRTPTSQRQKA